MKKKEKQLNTFNDLNSKEKIGKFVFNYCHSIRNT